MPYRSQLFQWMIHTRNGMIVTMFALSVMTFLFTLGIMTSPCSISKAQTICAVGDNETFTGPVTLQDELNVGSTPSPGSAGYVLTSQGDDTEITWNADFAVYKSADTSRSSTTTVTADPDLTFAAVPGKAYTFDMNLLVSGNTAGDFDFDFTLPISCTMEMMVVNDPATPTIAFHDNSGETTLQITATTQAYNGSGTLNCPGGAGVFSLDWAQNVSNGTATVLESGSWLRVTEINGS